MLLAKCSWHPTYRGYPKFLRVVSWRGWGLQWSDGICRACAARFRAGMRAA